MRYLPSIATPWICVGLLAFLVRLSSAQEPQLELQWTTNVPQLRLSGPAGTRTTVEYRSAFGPLFPWVPLAELELPAGGASLIDSGAEGYATRFYRAEFALPQSTSTTTPRTLFVTNAGEDGVAEPDRVDRPWGSLPAALAAARDGDTILVYPGTYTVQPQVYYDGRTPPLVIRERTNLVLQAMGDVRIYGREQGDFFLLEKCRNIVIAGFTIEGHYEEDPAKVSLQLRAAIRFQGECSNILIENNRVLHHNDHGIGFIKGYWKPSTNNIVIRHNYLEDIGFWYPELPFGEARYDGTAIVPAGGWLVEANTIVNCARGVEPYPNDTDISPFCVIRGNTIVNVADFGISSGGSLGNHYCVVENNYLETRPGFVFHGRHVERYSTGIEFGSAPNLRIRNNTVIGFPRAGIAMFSPQGTTNAVLQGNTIRGSSTGAGFGIVVGNAHGDDNNYSGLLIRDNTINLVSRDAISFQGKDGIIEGNFIANPSQGVPGGNGIHIRTYGSAAVSSNIVVRFNHVVNNQPEPQLGQAILVDAGSKNISLFGNTFQGLDPERQLVNRAPEGVLQDGYAVTLGSTNLATYMVVSDTLQTSALQLNEGGPDCRMGAVSLFNGTATVTTSAVTSQSRILLTTNRPEGQVGSPYVFERVAGVSFTIRSTSGELDQSEVAWLIIEPSSSNSAD